MSNCFCRVSHKSLPLPDDQALYDSKLQHRLLPTQIDPIQFEQMRPLDLTKPIRELPTLFCSVRYVFHRRVINIIGIE